MRKEKQFPSPPSVRGATGEAPPGLFQAEPSPMEERHPQNFSRYPIPCSARCLLSVLQQGGSFCSAGNKRGRDFLGGKGGTQLKPHKIPSSTSCPLVTTEPHLQEPGSQETSQDTFPAVSSNLPCLEPRFCCLHSGMRMPGCGPQAASLPPTLKPQGLLSAPGLSLYHPSHEQPN